MYIISPHHRAKYSMLSFRIFAKTMVNGVLKPGNIAWGGGWGTSYIFQKGVGSLGYIVSLSEAQFLSQFFFCPENSTQGNKSAQITVDEAGSVVLQMHSRKCRGSSQWFISNHISPEFGKAVKQFTLIGMLNLLRERAGRFSKNERCLIFWGVP